MLLSIDLIRTCSDLSILGEDSEIEVVVVVGDGHLASGIDANTDRVVGDPWNTIRKHYYVNHSIYMILWKCYCY